MDSLRDLAPGDIFVTYHMADGSTIDDHGWVTDLDYFDDLDDPVTVIRTVLRVESQRHLHRNPRIRLCNLCRGDEEIETRSRAWIQCPRCLGGGEEPFG